MYHTWMVWVCMGIGAVQLWPVSTAPEKHSTQQNCCCHLLPRRGYSNFMNSPPALKKTSFCNDPAINKTLRNHFLQSNNAAIKTYLFQKLQDILLSFLSSHSCPPAPAYYHRQDTTCQHSGALERSGRRTVSSSPWGGGGQWLPFNGCGRQGLTSEWKHGRCRWRSRC